MNLPGYEHERTENLSSQASAETETSINGVAARPEVPSATAWGFPLALAVMAGLASWGVGEATYKLFQPSEEASAQLYNFTALNREMAQANARNGALAYGAMGGFLGLALGLAGGRAGRSMARSIEAGAIGLLAGGAVGVVASYIIMPWHWAQRNDDPATLNLFVPLMFHAGLWCGMGFVAGAAYGWGRFGRRSGRFLETALGGLIGAVAGTLAYEMVGALVFPLSRTAEPIAEGLGARFLAHVGVAIFVTLGVLYTLRQQPERAPKPTPAPLEGHPAAS